MPRREGRLELQSVLAGVAMSLIGLLAMPGCETIIYRQFDYQKAEAEVGPWTVGAGLEGTWVDAGRVDERTLDRKAPYRLWLWLQGVPRAATVEFSDVKLVSATDSTTVRVPMGVAERSSDAEVDVVQGVTGDLELEYDDYVLTAQVAVEINSRRVERLVSLILCRSYSEARRNRQLERLRG